MKFINGLLSIGILTIIISQVSPYPHTPDPRIDLELTTPRGVLRSAPDPKIYTKPPPDGRGDLKHRTISNSNGNNDRDASAQDFRGMSPDHHTSDPRIDLELKTPRGVLRTAPDPKRHLKCLPDPKRYLKPSPDPRRDLKPRTISNSNGNDDRDASASDFKEMSMSPPPLYPRRLLKSPTTAYPYANFGKNIFQTGFK